MAKVRGSKNGNIISSRFKGEAKSLFPTLKQTKALVLLSVIGNEFCAGEYLQSMIETATSSHEFTTFLIADEVYWHNLRRDFSKEEELVLKRKAIELGEEYFERNLEQFLLPLCITKEEFNAQHEDKPTNKRVAILNGMANKKSNFEILFWKDWLNKNPNYQNLKKSITAQFDIVPSLVKSVEQMANNFAKRHHTNDKPYDLIIKRSHGYLIEESSAVVWIAASLGYNFIAYPGEMIKPFKAAKEFFIKEKNESSNKNDSSEIGFFIQADEPRLLVNWLEVTFQRTHEKQSTDSSTYTIAQLNQTKSELEKNKSTTSEMLKGITEGIFSLEIDTESKIKLLVDIMEEYKARDTVSCCEFKNEHHSEELFDFSII